MRLTNWTWFSKAIWKRLFACNSNAWIVGAHKHVGALRSRRRSPTMHNNLLGSISAYGHCNLYTLPKECLYMAWSIMLKVYTTTEFSSNYARVMYGSQVHSRKRNLPLCKPCCPACDMVIEQGSWRQLVWQYVIFYMDQEVCVENVSIVAHYRKAYSILVDTTDKDGGWWTRLGWWTRQG